MPRFLLVLLLAVFTWTGAPARSTRAAGTFSIMSFNVWTADDTAAGRTKLTEIMRLGQATNSGAPDILALQEITTSSASLIANALGYNFHFQSGNDIQILSRYPIVAQSPIFRGARIALPAGDVWVFNAHLAAYPYQPYDLRDGVLPMNEAAVIAAANAARGAQVTSYLNDMAAAMASGLPVLFAGDFNEPSHLDWTQAVADATERPYDLKVEYPASKRTTDAGFVDTLRSLRPDPIADRDYTWTPGYPPPVLDSNEVHDRIDFIYHRGGSIVPQSVAIVGYPDGGPETDIAIPGYNADHRAVVASYTLGITGDFNSDGFLTPADWAVLRDNQHTDLAGLAPSAAWLRGDLTGDLRNDHADFVAFKTAYDAENGAGAFAAALAAVPEPSGLALLAAAAPLAARRRRRLRAGR